MSRAAVAARKTVAEIYVALVALLPWGTLLLFHAIVVFARLRDGQWPYEQGPPIAKGVDPSLSLPEHWPNLGGLVQLLVVLIFAIGPLLPFGVALLDDRARARGWSLVFASGTYLLFAYLLADPFGFVDWFR